MSDSERIKLLVKYTNLSIRRLAETLGLSTAQTLYDISYGKHGITTRVADVICTAYPEINKVWLLTGEGEMLKSGMSISGNGNTQVHGNNNNVDSSALVSKALDEVSEIRKLLQEQIELCSTQAKTIARLTELLGK